jgi:hypothetical protein
MPPLLHLSGRIRGAAPRRSWLATAALSVRGVWEREAPALQLCDVSVCLCAWEGGREDRGWIGWMQKGSCDLQLQQRRRQSLFVRFGTKACQPVLVGFWLSVTPSLTHSLTLLLFTVLFTPVVITYGPWRNQCIFNHSILSSTNYSYLTNINDNIYTYYLELKKEVSPELLQ